MGNRVITIPKKLSCDTSFSILAYCALQKTEYYDLDIDLYGVIDIKNTTVNFLETEIEIKMKKENDDCHWKNLGIPTIEKKISKEDHPKVEVDSEFLEQVNKLSLTPTKPSPVIPQLTKICYPLKNEVCCD